MDFQSNMISDAQQIANQDNAKLGGVKTEEGKEISKFNALKHGILRESITDYEKDFYIQIYDDLVEQYKPVNIIEKILLERIAVNYLKLFRVQKTETEYLKSRLNPRIVKSNGLPDINEMMMKNEVVNEGYTPQITDEDIQPLVGIYSRYETTIENRLYRAIHELERVQAIRKGQTIPQNTTN